MKWLINLTMSLLLFCSFGFAKEGTFAQGYIENKGQIIDQNHRTNSEVKYLLLSEGFNIQLKANSFSYDIYSVEKFTLATPPAQAHIPEKFYRQPDSCVYRFHRIDVKFAGANPKPVITAELPFEGYQNYYTTATSEEGITRVQAYGKITYHNLYNGIDMEFVLDTKTQKPKYNFIVHPGADLSLIRWAYEGCNSSSLVNNIIRLENRFGVLEEKIPVSYLGITQGKVDIKYQRFGENSFGYHGKEYNRQETLIIDPLPQRIWSTYFGSSNRDAASDILVDSTGNSYLAGNTLSANNIATAGAYQSTYEGGLFGDMLIAKFNPSGTLIWATYLGGDKTDNAAAIAIDPTGNILISGTSSSSSNIATVGAHQTTNNGDPYFHRFYGDAILIKLNSNGLRQWGTYYGGLGPDNGSDLAFDNAGNILLAGFTQSPDNISTTGAYQTNLGSLSTWDGFIAKFSSTGSLLWATYYGGAQGDLLFSIAVDHENNIYAGGHASSSANISSPNSYQTVFAGEYDAMLLKFAPDGTRLWATYFGSDDYDDGIDMVIDKDSYLYITGRTLSTKNMSTPGVYQTSFGGASDAYLAKFNNSGTLIWSTYIGGEGEDGGNGVTVDASGFVYLLGNTKSYTGISDSNSYQKNLADSGDLMIFKLNKQGNKEWCSYYGGGGVESGSSIFTTGTSTYFHAVGSTSSPNSIASTNGYQQTFGGYDYDALLLKMSIGCPEVPEIIPPMKTKYCTGELIELFCKKNTWEKYQWMLNGNAIAGESDTFIRPINGGIYTLVGTLANGCRGISEPVSILINPNPEITLNGAADTSFCANTSFILKANATGGNLFQWFKDNASIAGAGTSQIQILSSGSYFSVITSSEGCTDTSSAVNIRMLPSPSGALHYSGNASFCYGGMLPLYADTGNDLSYEWFQNNSILPGETKQGYAVRQPGSYSVKTTNAFGCTANSLPVLVTVLPIPKASTIPHTSAGICKNDSLVITANSSSIKEYQWKQNGNLIPGANSSTLTVKVPGTYYVIETGINGCIDSSSVLTIHEYPSPVAGNIQGNSIADWSATYEYTALSPQMGYSYYWQTPKGYLMSGQGSTDIKVKWWGIDTGYVQLTVTDMNGCFDSERIPVKINYNPFDYYYAFSIYPNPATDSLTVLSTENLDSAEATIHDITARLIARVKFDGSFTERKINVSELSSGTYILTVRKNELFHRFWFIKL